ncbi:S-adenosylmethionine uptake transporter [Novosphingobium chloroacetimidivorans]|uniref:S-adenosylmethionine uptake transporter n=1 Tax=Novosphingobium chloroacetimidivorans TaxID=1428314 RepID=A0A7W7K6Z9_9SPHN|nr:DMT family transporter [Novosphingobium chloroacetimidivorans]MBB4857351.1 S-adenosylmethionine uptake transporter [Novosphingobium chloroacetimidivorans]
MTRASFLQSKPAPVLAVVLGIALFSGMDAAIKGAALMAGVYSALLIRNLIGVAMIVPIWLAGPRRWPSPAVLRLHILRSSANAAMMVLFFVGIVRLPIAEGIAISFIAPLIALYLAAVMLGETIRRQAVIASLLGIAGVGVIVADRFGTGTPDHDTLIGLAAIIASAVLYAINLVLQRKLALLAGPIEVTLFQNLVIFALLALAAPWLAILPSLPALGLITLGAALATSALALLAWGYARAETQVLVPIEYTAFLWAALLGWVFFDEPVGAATLAGTLLIVLGCWIGTRDPERARTEQTAV